MPLARINHSLITENTVLNLPCLFVANVILNHTSVFFLMLITAIVSSLLSTGITKFEFEKENEMNSGNCSQMMPS